VQSIVRREAMKKTFILISIAVILVLAACFATLTMNPKLVVNQDRSISTDTGKTYPSPLVEGTPNDSTGGQNSNSGDRYTKEQVITPSETSKDEGELNKLTSENTVNKEVNNLPNESASPADVPIPDGRIFLHGEPPYGYLPTVNPKENTTIPLIPLDFEG
jgi:hypothetical protein